MYGLIREGLQGLSLRGGAGRRPFVGSTVVYLGLTSLFTDISSEMVTAILPIYMLFQQQASLVQFGIVDGLYQGGSAIFRVITGFAADRMGRQKELATSGYALAAVARAGMAVGVSTTALTGLVLVDRFGKGIRTAPRDALISLSAPPEALGIAFGVHRTLDTIGAALGPLIAFTLLSIAPLRFDTVFVTSLAFAVIGVALVALFVQNPPRVTPATAEARPTFRDALGLLRQPSYRAVVLAGGAVSLFTVSDAFVYIVLQRNTGMGLSLFPLLFVGSSACYLVLAVPLGRIADRYGRMRTFLSGQVVLLTVYVALLATPLPALAETVLVLALFGAFYAATDGVLMAAASATLPEALRTSGLSFVGTVIAVARLCSSVLFGALWTWQGPEFALAVFFAGLSLAALAAAALWSGAARNARATAA